jgi:hypothetical protein
MLNKQNLEEVGKYHKQRKLRGPEERANPALQELEEVNMTGIE